jgi:hypothetical protein
MGTPVLTSHHRRVTAKLRVPVLLWEDLERTARWYGQVGWLSIELR